MNRLGGIIYLFFVFTVFLPKIAYAYLDPGSGNALVYVMISFFGAFLFSLKGIFYALVGKHASVGSEDDGEHNYDKIVIFSEGKQYWLTYKSIVEALLARKVYFSYYTMNVNDPCLEIESPFIRNRYIGDGHMAYAKMGNIKADVMLSTTPNIGTKGYPIPRSKNIGNLVHVLHSFDGIDSYHIGSLDHYDTVLTVGDFETKVIRDLEHARSLPEKNLVPAGVPYLDELGKRKIERLEGMNDVITVLVAPSWSTKGCLSEYGSGFIEDLAKAGFNIIVRPHPQSLIVEQELLMDIHNKIDRYQNVVWDFEVDGTKSMAKADVMISDTSGVRIDFMLIYNKPVISLSVPISNMQEFEIAYMKEVWLETQIDKYGARLDHSNINSIVDVVEKSVGYEKERELIQFRKDHLYNFMHSGEVIADYLISASDYKQETEDVI